VFSNAGRLFDRTPVYNKITSARSRFLGTNLALFADESPLSVSLSLCAEWSGAEQRNATIMTAGVVVAKSKYQIGLRVYAIQKIEGNAIGRPASDRESGLIAFTSELFLRV